MDRILIAGYGCIAVGFGIAYISALRERRLPNRPCAFCGAELVPPLYQCSHNLGDGRATTSPAATVGLRRRYTKRSA
jgi:hypothetical protein